MKMATPSAPSSFSDDASSAPTTTTSSTDQQPRSSEQEQQQQEGKPRPLTATEQIHDQAVKWVLDHRLSAEEKIQRACHLFPPEEGHLNLTTASKLHLSPALDWSGPFRKCYSLVMWMKPTTQPEDESSRQSWKDAQEAVINKEGCLYRLEQAQTAQAWLGVEVSLGDWKKAGDHHVECWVKATTLEGGNNSAKIETTLRLPTDAWSLVGMTHVFPYLKRPQWTLTVNGHPIVTGELPYPNLDHLQGKNAAKMMDLTIGGWNGSISSWAIYQEPIMQEALALVTEAGPGVSNSQQPGSVIPRVPPIANSSKGYSLDGRSKVGCCLLVHPLSQALQPLLDAHVVGWGFHSGPTKRERLGNSGNTRYTWNLPKLPGKVKDVPRVGLIQPQPPLRQPFWTMTVTDAELSLARHASLGDALQMEDSGRNLVKRYDPSATPSLRLALIDQALHRWILPFFVAFPVTFVVDDVVYSRLQRHSLRHLWGLLHEVPIDWSMDGLPQCLAKKKAKLERKNHENTDAKEENEDHNVCLAAVLLHVLAEWVALGGARVQEHILQEGMFHMLSCCLRWVLLRAEAWDVYNCESADALVQRCLKATQDEGIWVEQIQQGSRRFRPKKIPDSIADGMVHLLEACFFGRSTADGILSDIHDPWSIQWLQLRLTGDLALTALFGLALDFDLWGGTAYESAAKVFKVVAKAYGGCHVEAGTVIRSQISVQFLLDNIRLSLDEELQKNSSQYNHQQSSNVGGENNSEPTSKHAALQESAIHLANILKAMLLASLSNMRSISQGENDISACIGALSSCPLGSVGCHVILHALIGVLEWCEILPTRVNADDRRAYTGSSASPLQNSHEDEEEIAEKKQRMATRLARNLMMSQFHDVVGPMLLSRTVFAGDRRLPAPVYSTSPDADEKQPILSWQNHWRWVLMIYSWCSSVAGPEGIISAQSSGSLCLASGLAGSLKGILNSMEPNFVTTLFLPTIATSGADEEAYHDMLTARLQVMMPLLPGMVVSLLEHPSDAVPDSVIPSRSVEIVAELLTAVGASFSRIFSQWNALVTPADRQRNSQRKQTRSFIVNQIIQAAKAFAPPLMIVAMLIENHVQLRYKPEEEPTKPLTLLRPEPASEDKRAEREDDSDAWVEVSQIVRQLSSSALMSTFSDVDSDMPEGSSEKQVMMSRLRSCQNSVMSTLTDLISVSMKLGGGEASTSFWRTILATLKESVAYSANAPSKNNNSSESDGETSLEPPTKEEALVERKAHAEALAQNILCRMASLVLVKCLKRESQWDVWNADLCAAVSKLCILIEEKELFKRLLGPTCPEYEEGTYSNDQVLLLGALLNILEYGRDVTGWCQIILPMDPAIQNSSSSLNATGSNEDALDDTPKKRSSVKEMFKFTHKSKSTDPLNGASKVMLQVLQPSLRIVVSCVGNTTTLSRVFIPQPLLADDDISGAEKDSSTGRNCLLLEYTLEEMQATLTAAIVGLSFVNARDVCLNALASLRRAILRHQHRKDDLGVDLCFQMMCSVVEEMRVRYIGERRRRETALFDAYEENDDAKQRSRQAAESSRAIENLMLGGELSQAPSQGLPQASLQVREDIKAKDKEKAGVEEANLEPGNETAPEKGDTSTDTSGNKMEKSSDDFVVFHEGYDAENASGSEKGGKKMGYAQYDGFAVALENCSSIVQEGQSEDKESTTASESSTKADEVISALSPFLDSFDETMALEAAESELVELFDTNIHLDSSVETAVTASISSGPLALPQLPIVGAETAADAMTSFIEFAAAEKSRLTEISSSFLPSHRYSRLAFTQRFCWARYIELSEADNDFSMSKFWERGINDGNRDVRSRLITMPCLPQFKRYIPKYLDHAAHDTSESSSEMDSAQLLEDSERPVGKKRSSLSMDMFGNRRGSKGRRKSELFSATDDEEEDDQEADMDLELEVFSKTLSAATGGQIVDITKKEIKEEDEPNVFVPRDRTASTDDVDESYIAEGEDRSSKGGSEQYKESNATMITDESIRPEHEPPMKNVSIDAKAGAAHYQITSSAFASPPDNSSSSLSIMHSAAAALIEQYLDNCLHVKAEGSRICTVLLTSMHLILEYDMEEEGHFEGEVMASQEEADRVQRYAEDPGRKTKDQETDRRVTAQAQRNNQEEAALRPKSIRFNLSEVSHIYLRRYRLRDSSIELFFIPSGGTAFGGYGIYSPLSSLFIDFGPGQEGLQRRDDAAFAIMRRTPPQTIKQWPDRSEQFLHEQLTRLTIGWAEGRVTNFDYLLHLNMLAGRSYNDICQYPVMPWVLADYKSQEIPDLNDPKNFRDLSKPVGALNPDRLQDFIERFNSFVDPLIPPFMYGSHYSTSAGVVLHFLVRMHPFAGLHRQLQSGHFDVADRLFSSIPRTWDMCTGSSAAEVKELTPEFCEYNKTIFKVSFSLSFFSCTDNQCFPSTSFEI